MSTQLISPTTTIWLLGQRKSQRKLKQLKAEADGPVVMIENGDFIQGSPLSYYIAKSQHPVAELTKVINHMAYDVHVFRKP